MRWTKREKQPRPTIAAGLTVYDTMRSPLALPDPVTFHMPVVPFTIVTIHPLSLNVKK